MFQGLLSTSILTIARTVGTRLGGIYQSLRIAQVKFKSRSNFFYFSFFFLLMSSGCYSLLYNDVLVVKYRTNNFQVCNIFLNRSLEPLLLCCDSLLLWKI